MFHSVGRIVFVASILRIVGAVAVVGAIAFGVYLSLYDSVVTGVVWIVSALVGGWIGNMIFNLVHVLGSAAAGPFVPGSNETNLNVSANNRNRYRGLHTSLSGRKSR